MFAKMKKLKFSGKISFVALALLLCLFSGPSMGSENEVNEIWLRLKAEGLINDSDVREIKTCVKSAYQTYATNGHHWLLKNAQQNPCNYYTVTGTVGGGSVINQYATNWGDTFVDTCLCLEWATDYVVSKDALVRILGKHSESLESIHKGIGAIPAQLQSDPDFIEAVTKAVAKKLTKLDKWPF